MHLAVFLFGRENVVLFLLLAIDCVVCNIFQKLAAKSKPSGDGISARVTATSVGKSRGSVNKFLKMSSAGSSDYRKRLRERKRKLHKMIVCYRDSLLLTEQLRREAAERTLCHCNRQIPI